MKAYARYLSVALAAFVAAMAHGQTPTPVPNDQDISDSYIYLLSRLLVLNQEQADFSNGFQ